MGSDQLRAPPLPPRSADGHRMDPLPGRVEQRVGDRRPDGDYGIRPRPRRFQVLAVQQDHVQLGKVTETWYPVRRKSRVRELAVLDQDLLPQGRACAHHDAAFHLGAWVGRIQDGSALEVLDHLDQPRYAAGAIHLYLEEGRYHGVLFGPAGEADADSQTPLLAPLHP